MAITVLDLTNPDSESISRKEQIDISISLFDVSASGYYNQIQTNYIKTEQTLIIPDSEYTEKSLYYTPLYTEKLNYDRWLLRVNKNFRELD